MKFVLALVLLPAELLAQNLELGIQAGVANYWGDLAPKVVMTETHTTAGAFFRVNLSNTWAWKNELNVLKVSGSDKHFAFNQDRNLSFYSQVEEFSSVFEFNFFKYGPFVLDRKFTSYVYVGLAGFHFNPQTKLNGKTYDLHDYQTEGVNYNRFAMAIPFGMGVKWMTGRKFALEAHVGFRKTYTDYLDDVSGVYPDVQQRFSDGIVTSATLSDRSIEKYGTPQNKLGYKRGNSEYKDWYMTATVSVVMRLHRKVRCSRFY